MIRHRPAAERGRTQIDWLESYHSFSFGSYHDPEHTAFGPLRVINDDRVAAGGGFGMHPHRDMEIITVVFAGQLEHRDSLGHGSVIKPGDVQMMTAGTGIRHSEFNPSPTEPVHLLQIWILPREKGLEPSYHQRQFPAEARAGKLAIIAAPPELADGDGALPIHQDAVVMLTTLRPGDEVTHQLAVGRRAWVQVARGKVRLNEIDLAEGDGAAIEDEPHLILRGEGEAIVFDLP